MYDELIKSLRICSRCDFGQDCNGCKQKSDDAFCCDKLLHEAADAIEELVRKEKFHAFLWNTIQPNEMEAYLTMYNAGNEKVES